jgi:methylated-DNA-protein-cysteine methyltransferase-like protein
MTAPFFEQVYRLVRCIPPGRVATYGQIAQMLGQPRAARTVGWALRATPEDRAVPWQRVINAQGKISLGPDRGAAALQRVLLEEEGIHFDDQGRIDLDRYGWWGLDPLEVRQLIESEP